MTDDHKSERESGWYIFSADNGVIAGPIADRDAAERLAEGYGPGHVIISEGEVQPPAKPVESEIRDE